MFELEVLGIAAVIGCIAAAIAKSRGHRFLENWLLTTAVLLAAALVAFFLLITLAPRTWFIN